MATQLTDRGKAALAQIKAAKWGTTKSLLVTCQHNVPLVVTAEALAARVAVPGGFRIGTVGDGFAFDTFPAANVEKAVKLGRQITFNYLGYIGALFENGTLKVGCQIRPLKEFLPGGAGDEYYAVRVANDDDRTALVKALQTRLRALKVKKPAAKKVTAAKKVAEKVVAKKRTAARKRAKQAA